MGSGWDIKPRTQEVNIENFVKIKASTCLKTMMHFRDTIKPSQPFVIFCSKVVNKWSAFRKQR